MVYGHKIWQISTSRAINLNETNQESAGNLIISKSCKIWKKLFSARLVVTKVEQLD